METPLLQEQTNAQKAATLFGQIVLSVVVLFLFLVALELISGAASHLDAGFIEGLIQVTSNPFVALFIGLQISAIIQSSSTFTSSMVAMVAANIISLEAAVPMVLGANIGTTVTSMLVSFSNLGTPKAFRRGFMVASSHLIFNVLTTILFLFLEFQGKILSTVSQNIARHLFGFGPATEVWTRFHTVILSPFTGLIQSLVQVQPFIILGLSLILLFICIYLFTIIFRWMIMADKGTNVLTRALNNSKISFLSGIGITAAIHSSTVTTSLSVILANSEKIPPKKFFPFIIGANVGTTITALMAAIGRSESALAIALCHFIFNAGGALIFYPIPFLRAIPMGIARWTADLAFRNRAFAFGYLLLVFFALPFLVIFISVKM